MRDTRQQQEKRLLHRHPTNTVTVTTMKKNQSGDQISAAGKGSERLIGHRSSYV